MTERQPRLKEGTAEPRSTRTGRVARSQSCRLAHPSGCNLATQKKPSELHALRVALQLSQAQIPLAKRLLLIGMQRKRYHLTFTGIKMGEYLSIFLIASVELTT